MKVFVIGSVSVEEGDPDLARQHDLLRRSMEVIGESVVRTGHDLVVCSPFEGTADVAAVRGAAAAQAETRWASVEFHYPDYQTVKDRLAAFVAEVAIRDHRTFTYPTPRDESGQPQWRTAWLLSQLSALHGSHAVVALGGQAEGTSNLVLPLAEGQRKPVLPLTFLGGAADVSFQRRHYELADRLGDEVRCLDDPGAAGRVVDLLLRLADDSFRRPKRSAPLRAFISYPQSRPHEADLVETTLIRRHFLVLRDDKDFGPAQSLPGLITENIHKADVFVALWCQEYACSPWCYDELELALKRSAGGGLTIWFLCLDTTRVVPPAARGLVNYPVKTRAELVGKLVELIDRLGRQS